MNIGEVLRFLLPTVLDEEQPPDWPPDVFALVSAVLQRGDAYRDALDLAKPGRSKRWSVEVHRLAKEWRTAAAERKRAPRSVHALWEEVCAEQGTELSELPEQSHSHLRLTLLRLLAAADETCNGIGIAQPRSVKQPGPALLLYTRAMGNLMKPRATLCERVDPSRAVVLPKQRVPQSGMTIRGLSRHLALVDKPEIRVSWNSTLQSLDDDRPLNMLLLPWPEEIRPTQFKVEQSARDGFGTFSCALRRARSSWVKRAVDAFRRAEGIVGSVDMIVFPELALLPGEAERICKQTGAFVIGGVGLLDSKKEKANRIDGVFPPRVGDPESKSKKVSGFQQNKHHRWKLDESQIVQYGISPQLSPLDSWWEHFRIDSRSLTFWNPRRWLTACALICEDLARPDPAADVIRAVGPNLVIAVLLDGPQLKPRWPARYATVLADDPGSSVLTLTCLGMALLSRPSNQPPSRIVALWKDASTGVQEILLPEGCEGLVLTLRRKSSVQWTADGRRHEDTHQIVWSGCTSVPMG